MQLQLNREVFAEALARVVGIASKDKNLPVLRNVLIKAEESISLFATNLELSIWTKFEGVVMEPGAITIPAKEALGIVRGFNNRDIQLESSQNQVTFKAGKSRRSLQALPAEDFPYQQTFDEVIFTQCDKESLTRALSKILYTVPSESDPFSQPGAYVDPIGAETLRFVASDGHRLAFHETPAMGGIDLGGAIIPRKGIEEMLKALEHNGGSSIAREGDKVFLKTNGTVLSMQLLEGDYPEYGVIIPEIRPGGATLPTEKIRQSVKSMSVFFTYLIHPVMFHFAPGRLSIQTKSQELGEAEDEIEIEYDGDEFSVPVNGKYILQTLANMTSERMRMEWVDGFHAVILLEEGNPDALHLIMPMVV